LADDEQLKARGFFVQAEHPAMGKVTYPGASFKMSETPSRIGKAPLLGEDNEAIYGGLGLSVKDQAALKKQGII